MKKLRAIALSTVTVASMLALAACGGGSSTTKPAGAASSLSKASASASAPPGTLTASSALTIVSHAVLGNGDLGDGWSGRLIDDGGTTDSPTLDTCDISFPSETLRLARNQTELDSRTVDVSNEVVAYKPGGAKQAMAELVASLTTCSGKPQDNGEGTDSYRLTFKRLTPHASWGTDSVAVSYTATDLTDPSNSYNGYSVFVVNGDLISGVYDWDGPVTQDLIFQVADLAAKRLSEAIADQPRTTASIPVPPGPPLPTDEPSDGTGGGGSSI